MKNRYSARIEGETAKVLGRDLPISKKHSVEICRWLRKKRLDKAQAMIEKVLKKELAVPYKRYTWNLGHKKGISGPGRYPIKTAKEILKLLKSAETNAQFKGMNTSNLTIEHINAHQASSPWHFGRQRRRKMKRCHVEVIVKEGLKKKEGKTEKKKKAPEKETQKKVEGEKKEIRKETAKETKQEDKKVDKK